jgi:hypothetical protein
VSTPTSTTLVPRSRAMAGQPTSEPGLPGRQMPGDDDDLARHPAVGDRHPGQGRDGGRGHARRETAVGAVSPGIVVAMPIECRA